MRTITFLIVLLSTIAALMTGGCSNSVAGGNSGGTEITNGRVTARSGAAASGLTVSAYPVTFIRGQSSVSSVITSVTGSDGAFTIAIDSGLYNIFIIDSIAGSGVYVKSAGPKTELGTLQLDTLGAVTGTVHADMTGISLVVYSRGTPFRDDLYGADSSFSFTRVPSGRYELSIATEPKVGCLPGMDCNPAGGGTSPGDRSLSVSSGGTTVVDTLVRVELLGELQGAE